MYCSECGKEIEENVKFCAHCGNRVENNISLSDDTELMRYPNKENKVKDVYLKNIGSDGLYIYSPSRSFGNAIATCLEKYFTFNGRASRSEYWFFILFTGILGILASVFDLVFFGDFMKSSNVSPINTLVSLLLLFPSSAVAWRRLHDTNRSGWLIGGFYLAILGAIISGGLSAAQLAAKGQQESALIGVGVMVILLLIVIIVFSVYLLIAFCQLGDKSQNNYG